MLLLWNSQQKTMNTLNIPDDNRGVMPFLPPRTIMVLKNQGGFHMLGVLGGTLPSLFWIGYINCNCIIYCRWMQHLCKLSLSSYFKPSRGPPMPKHKNPLWGRLGYILFRYQEVLQDCAGELRISYYDFVATFISKPSKFKNWRTYKYDGWGETVNQTRSAEYSNTGRRCYNRSYSFYRSVLNEWVFCSS